MCVPCVSLVFKLKFLLKEALKCGKIKRRRAHSAAPTEQEGIRNGDVLVFNAHSSLRVPQHSLGTTITPRQFGLNCEFTHNNPEWWFHIISLLNSIFYNKKKEFSAASLTGRPFSIQFLKYVKRVLRKFPIKSPFEESVETTTEHQKLKNYIQAALTFINVNTVTTVATGLVSRQPFTEITPSVNDSIVNPGKTEKHRQVKPAQIINKIGTWNICGLGDKETEIVEFMQQHKIGILGISDVRRKGQNTKEIHKNYVLIWSGTKQEERNKHGVGFIIEPQIAKNILEIEYISERIVLVRTAEGKEKATYIQIYAPCNDTYTEEVRIEFFNELSDIISHVKDSDKIFIMGDFNGHLGQRRPPWESYLGPFGDEERRSNSNGELILNLCAEYDLTVANTLYQHRRSQISTWYKWDNLQQASQIDFILIRRQQRWEIKDSKAIPNAILDTDHRPVILWRSKPASKQQSRKTRVEIINLRNLQDKDTQDKIDTSVKSAYSSVSCLNSIEEDWSQFKDTILKAVSEHCGLKQAGQSKRKHTLWWNEEVRASVKEKKKMFKVWQKSNSQEHYVNYRLARRECKRIIGRAKANSWQQFGDQIARTCVESPRDFYKSVKAMRMRNDNYNPSNIINNENGEPITNNNDIKNRWRNYFKVLLNQNEQEVSGTYTLKQCDVSEPYILKSEVEWALSKSKKNKAAGIDGITTEMLISCKQTSIEWLTRIFNTAFKERQVPEDWRRAIIIPLWKNKGSKRDCEMYRGISLLSQVGKIYAKILEQRIRPIVEPQLSNNQFGFRKGKSCTDAIFTMRQLCEQTLEYNKTMNTVFIDQEKAFDRVNRIKLWQILEEYGVKGQLLENIIALYKSSESAVRTRVGLSDWFPITSGVRQGCVLSPLLFIIYMDKITKKANMEMIMSENPNDQEENIHELLFADDQCVIYENEEHLQVHTTALYNSCREYDMNINTAKTETMRIDRKKDTLHIDINGADLKQVQEFKYLGSIFTDDGKLDREIEARTQKANAVSYQLTPLLKHPNITINAKRQMINSIFIPTLCYESQTWALTKTQEQKITTCEMRCLRKVTNNTRRDRIPNSTIRRRVGTRPCTEYIERQRMKWFGHLIRMKPDQIPYRAFYSRTSGRRARGRPRIRWIDCVKGSCEKKGISVSQAACLARDRQRI